MQITVLYNQSLLDIAIKYCGTVESVVDIAVLNKISITAELVPGEQLIIPTKDYGCQEVISFFNENKLNPATALTELDTALTEGDFGIGLMTIETTFIVR